MNPLPTMESLQRWQKKHSLCQANVSNATNLVLPRPPLPGLDYCCRYLLSFVLGNNPKECLLVLRQLPKLERLVVQGIRYKVNKVFCKRDGNESLLQARWQRKHMFCEMEYVCHRVCPTAFEACPGKLIRDKQANTKEGNGPARDQLRQTKVAQNRHGYHPKLFFGYSLTNTLDCNLQRVCW